MKINGKRLMSNLAALRKFTDTPGNGVTRFSYGEQDAKARQFIIERAQEIRCTVRTDRIGNIRIGLASNKAGRPTILCGSHIDTVRNGGWLDGIYGVCSALEVLQTLAEASGDGAAMDAVSSDGAVPDAGSSGDGAALEAAVGSGGAAMDAGSGDGAPLNYEMVIFAEEEGSNFGSTMTGSKFITGKYTEENLDKLTRDDGATMRQVLREAGLGDEEARDEGTGDEGTGNEGAGERKLDPVPWDLSEAAAMLELHIEQGPVLDRQEIPIGIVDSIFGMRVVEVTLTGVGNHAGATPMHERYDALTGAAECILAAEATVAADPDEQSVVTIGKIEVQPNCSNVIPETVRFSMEVRDKDRGKIDQYMEQIAHDIRQLAMDRGLHCQIQDHSASDPLHLDDGIRDLICQAAVRAEIPYRIMDSGAVHDACMIAEAGVPTGMIFVPSIGGRSHVPEEDTKEEDLIRGAQLLLEAVEQLRMCL